MRKDSSTKLHLEALEDRSVPATLHGVAFFDHNLNGHQELEDGPIAGVGVALSSMSGSLVSTTTDASGFYAFTGLGLGSYQVNYTPTVGFVVNAPLGGRLTVNIAADADDVAIVVGLIESGATAPPPAMPPTIEYYDLWAGNLLQAVPVSVAGKRESNLLVRTDLAANWVANLSAPGMELTTTTHNAPPGYVRLILPDATRNSESHARIVAAFGAAGLVGDREPDRQEAVTALYSGLIANPPGYPDRFLGLDAAGQVHVYNDPAANITPSNLLVRADQAADWVARLSAAGQWTTVAPGGGEYVRLVLPDSARAPDGIAYARIVSVFRSAGLTGPREAELQVAMAAIYRGAISNPPGYTDQYLILDPETGTAYLSTVRDFGASQLSGDISRVSPERLESLIRDGYAQRVDGYIYVAWVDVATGRSHRIVFEPYGIRQVAWFASPDGVLVPLNGLRSVRGEQLLSGDFYKPVLLYKEPLGSMTPAARFEAITSPNAAATAVLAAVAAREAGTAQATWTAITLGVNLVPLWSAVDNAQRGEYTEAGVSLIGDASLFVGVGLWARGAQAGRALRTAMLVTATAEAGVGVYRIKQGVEALQTGEDLVAAAKFGEAALRLVGITPSVAAYMRATARARVLAAEAENAARLVTSKGTPVNPIGTGRKLSIYGEGEAAGFENVATEAQYANNRPLTSTIPDTLASDLALRDSPLSAVTLAEMKRLAKPRARITYSNADVEGFAAYVQQLKQTFPNSRIVYQGTVTDTAGIQRGIVVLELP